MTKLNDLVTGCVENLTTQELALGWVRYEVLRKLSPLAFAELSRRNCAGENFDAMVDELVVKK